MTRVFVSQFVLPRVHYCQLIPSYQLPTGYRHAKKSLIPKFPKTRQTEQPRQARSILPRLPEHHSLPKAYSLSGP